MGFLYNGSKKRLYFIQFLLIVAVTYLIYCFLPKERGAVLPNYEEKKPWSGTAVIADQSFPILRSEEDVRADSLSILEEFKPYYNLNENTADKVSADIAAAIEKSQKPELLALIDPLKRRLHALYSKGVISDDEKAKVTGGTEISVIETKGKTKTVLTTDINDLWVLSHLYNQLFMDEHIKQQQEALKALGIEEYLVPNLERDEEKCETELKDMFATIARYAGDVAKGEKIIDHGQIVDETSYLKLKSFEEKLKGEELIGKQVLTKRLGQALLVMLFLGLLTVYLNLFKEDYTVKLRHMLLFYTLLLIFPLMALLFQRYTPIDVYILPFAIVGVLRLAHCLHHPCHPARHQHHRAHLSLRVLHHTACGRHGGHLQPEGHVEPCPTAQDRHSRGPGHGDNLLYRTAHADLPLCAYTARSPRVYQLPLQRHPVAGGLPAHDNC